MVAPTLQRWGDDWALRYLTDPTQHCRSQNHHTGPDSVEIPERNNVIYDREQTLNIPSSHYLPWHLFTLKLPDIQVCKCFSWHTVGHEPIILACTRSTQVSTSHLCIITYLVVTLLFCTRVMVV